VEAHGGGVVVLSVPGQPGRLRAGRLTESAAAALAAAALALAAITGLVTFTGNDPDDLGAALLRAALVLLPIAIGLLIWTRLPEERFGRLLVAGGLVTFLAALGGSDNPVLYSIGRVATWLAEVALIYLILAFPSGRLRQPIDRVLVGLIALVVGALFLPTALLTDRYPVPATWTTCTEGCPTNAFQVVHDQPGWVSGVVFPLRESLAALLFLAVTVLLLVRVARASTATRRTLTPVVAGAAVHAVALPVAFSLRRIDGSSDSVLTLTWVLAAGLPVVALGFLLGAWRWRLAIGNALYRLAPQLPGGLDPERLRAVLADALDDPGIDLVYQDGGQRWLDTTGRTVELPGRESGRAHTVIFDRGSPVAAILHHEALEEQRTFVTAVGSLAAVALTNHRLAAQVEASLKEVRRSRERILAVADEERRRIERNLHDGAQQRLVALRIKLELASELSAEQHLPDAEHLHMLSEEVGDALDDVRSLAAGVYPALLVDCGLDEALRSVARRSPVRARVAAQGVDRYSQQVEAAVYFSCLEALQNAGKHAEARSVSIVVADGDGLRFEVRDDGRGFDVDGDGEGHGLRNIRDRLVAVGGDLVVESSPGRGTRIAGTIPHATAR
jgi:signal transduction histidine kinase